MLKGDERERRRQRRRVRVFETARRVRYFRARTFPAWSDFTPASRDVYQELYIEKIVVDVRETSFSGTGRLAALSAYLAIDNKLSG